MEEFGTRPAQRPRATPATRVTASSSTFADRSQENRAMWSVPAAITAARRTGSSSSRTAAAKAAASVPGAYSAPPPATSRKIGMSVTTAGTPSASASATGSP